MKPPNIQSPRTASGRWSVARDMKPPNVRSPRTASGRWFIARGVKPPNVHTPRTASDRSWVSGTIPRDTLGPSTLGTASERLGGEDGSTRGTAGEGQGGNNNGDELHRVMSCLNECGLNECRLGWKLFLRWKTDDGGK